MVPFDLHSNTWRKLDELDTSTLQGWTFFETPNAYLYSWLCPFLHGNTRVHLTSVNAVLFLSDSLTQFYEAKPICAMDLMEAEIYLRPRYLQIQVRNSKRNYTFGLNSTKEYTFLIKSIKCQIEAKERQKELWLRQRICSLHRASARFVRKQTEFCDDTLYDMIRKDMERQRLVTSTRGQRVWRLRTLARGWWPSCCFLMALFSSYNKINR